MRDWLSALAVVLACAAAAQIGFVRSADTRRATELQRQLGDLELESRRAIDRLSKRLETTRVREQRLRVELMTREHENTSLAQELQLARASTEELQERVDGLVGSLREERPALEVRLEPTEPLERIVLVAENPGSTPVEIIEASGWLWLDDGAEDAGDRTETITLDPDTEADFFSYHLIGDEPRRVSGGESRLRAAVCLVYQRSVEDDSTAWVDEYWFEYAPPPRAPAVLRHISWPLVEDEAPCDLELDDTPW